MSDIVYRYQATPQPKARPPPGMSDKEFMALHSMPCLDWKKPWKHMQVFAHRCDYAPGDYRMENTLKSFRIATENGFNNHETDVCEVINGHVNDHDLGANRNLRMDVCFEDMNVTDLIGRPIFRPSFTRWGFAPSFDETDQSLMSSVDFYKQALTINPQASFFADCRNDHFASFFAVLSKEPLLAKRITILFYMFTRVTAMEVEALIRSHHPDKDGFENVGLVLSLYADNLTTAGLRLNMPVKTVDEIAAVFTCIMETYLESSLDLRGVLLLISPFGELDTTDMGDEIKQRFIAEEGARKGYLRLKTNKRFLSKFPSFKFGGGLRAYDGRIVEEDQLTKEFTFDLKNGSRIPWPENQTRMIREAYATPGVSEHLLNPDFMITDTPTKSAFNCCGVPADDRLGYHHPRFDLVACRR